MIEKEILTARKAAEKVKDGDVVMMGGFINCGTPESLMEALIEQGTKQMTLIANDTAFYIPKQNISSKLGQLVLNKQFSKIIASHIGTNVETQRQMNSKETEVMLVPQGSLAEKIRAGGAGLGGILTPTGVGTEVENGKQVVTLNGKRFLVEEAVKADVALIKAAKADKAGNLIYAKAARNFNPIMATAAELVIAEVDEIVDIGQIDPQMVVTPSIFVDFLVLAGS